MMLHCSNEAHVYLLHPVQARDLINQLAKKLVSFLASLNLSCAVCSSTRILITRFIVSQTIVDWEIFTVK